MCVCSKRVSLAMRYTSSFIAVFLTLTATLVGALPPSSIESRENDLDPNLFTLPEDDLGVTTNVDGGVSDLDFSSALLALNPDDANTPLFDDSSSSSLLPADDMIISDGLASSCLAPASKKRDFSNEDLLLLCRTPHPFQHRTDIIFKALVIVRASMLMALNSSIPR